MKIFGIIMLIISALLARNRYKRYRWKFKEGDWIAEKNGFIKVVSIDEMSRHYLLQVYTSNKIIMYSAPKYFAEDVYKKVDKRTCTILRLLYD